MAYVQAIQNTGAVIAGAGLEVPENGKIVRVRDGSSQVQDGPYAETKESLAGFLLIEVPSMEVALDWAKKSPWATYASVEVRGIMPPGDTRAPILPA
jgi:hypothetical protein